MPRTAGPRRYRSDPATSPLEHLWFRGLRTLARGIVRSLYRLEAKGLEHIPEHTGAIVVANHVSFIDWLIVGATLPRVPRFVMHHHHFRYRALRWFFRASRVIPIAPRKEDPEMLDRALDRIDEALAHGELVLIFPEGRMTPHGELSAIRPGVERIVARRPVPVIPVALRGLWGSFFSCYGGPPMRKRPRRLWAKVQVVADEPIAPTEVSVDRIAHALRTLRGAPC
ncbi:MAG: 1-acyl-sn-glycerol-3-phosphate acyltransferase [Sandaracinaceae bacterium]